MTHVRRLLVFFALISCASCAGPRGVSERAPRAEPAPEGPQVSPAPVPPGSASEASLEREAEPLPSFPPYEGPAFEQSFEGAVRSLAIGKAPRAALLAEAPYLFDGSNWTRREVPARLLPSSELSSVEVFFGRDNQPRLMGTRRSEQGPRSVYLRHKAGGWQEEPSELGPMVSAREGLFGVLGFDDPEVVCGVGHQCVVKRVSGWSTLSAPAGVTRLFLTRGEVYAPAVGGLLQLSQNGWRALMTLDFVPLGMCRESAVRLWAVAESESTVRLRDGEAGFLPVRTPLVHPRQIFCESEGWVWVVGLDGAAVYDGATWRHVPGDFGALSSITGDAARIWLGGERGVFVGRRGSP